MEHLQTLRDAADELDVIFLHYDDLKADLEGQMRQLAARLGIHVDEHRWPHLVQAATFESMRSRADTTVPGGGVEHWVDPAAFFSRGTSGQWRDLLDGARRWVSAYVPRAYEAGALQASATLGTSFIWTEPSRATVDALEEEGVDVTLRMYEGEGHTFEGQWRRSIERTTAFFDEHLT